MDQQCSDENNNQSSQSQDIESETINTNQDDTEVTSTRDILSGIDSSPEKDISVAYERLTLGRPRTDWSGLCWDPELVQNNEHSDTPPHAADQSATQQPAATSTQAATSTEAGESLEGANPAQDEGKADPRAKEVIEEAKKRADEEEEYFALIQSYRPNPIQV